MVRPAFGQEPALDWAFIYYMPYDNDLSDFADPIINMVEKGVESDNVMAFIQTDRAGNTGIDRYVIDSDSATLYHSDIENSASPAALQQYLAWVGENYPAKNYAFVFLNHGGKADQIGLDEGSGKPEWMRIDSVAGALRAFNKQVNQKLELLYLQVCAKGNIESLFEFHDVSNYTLFSQHVLKAPNFYYTETLNDIGKNPNMNGEQLARNIVNNDSTDMYLSMTCIDNSKWTDMLIEFYHLKGEMHGLPVDTNKLHTVTFDGQEYWDFSSYLKSHRYVPRKVKQARKAYLKMINAEFVVVYKTNPAFPQIAPFCGISMLSQEDYKITLKYKHLQFYDAARLHLHEVHEH